MDPMIGTEGWRNRPWQVGLTWFSWWIGWVTVYGLFIHAWVQILAKLIVFWGCSSCLIQPPLRPRYSGFPECSKMALSTELNHGVATSPEALHLDREPQKRGIALRVKCMLAAPQIRLDSIWFIHIPPPQRMDLHWSVGNIIIRDRNQRLQWIYHWSYVHHMWPEQLMIFEHGACGNEDFRSCRQPATTESQHGSETNQTCVHHVHAWYSIAKH